MIANSRTHEKKEGWWVLLTCPVTSTVSNFRSRLIHGHVFLVDPTSIAFINPCHDVSERKGLYNRFVGMAFSSIQVDLFGAGTRKNCLGVVGG